MENNIFEPNKDFVFSNISLAQPVSIQGGAYFTKIQYNDKPFFIETPKSLTKQGFVKNGKKLFCDLMFDNSNEEFINWIENLETKCQELIYEKGDLWFQNKLELNDIETAFTSALRIYKSGKYYLMRVNVKMNYNTNIPLIKIYNESEVPLNIDEIKSDTNLISIIEIQGIRFTSRNFQIELEMKQAMVLNTYEIFDNCLIKKNFNKSGSNSKEPLNKIPLELNLSKNNNDDEESFLIHRGKTTHNNDDDILEKPVNKENPTEMKNIENAVLIPGKIINESVNEDDDDYDFDLLQDKEEDRNGENDKTIVEQKEDPKINSVLEENKETEEPRESDVTQTIIVDTDYDTNLFSNNNNNSIESLNSTGKENNDNSNIILNVEELEDDTKDLKELEDLEFNTDTLESIKLKKPNEVYYQIYKEAKKRAKQAKKDMMIAYLEAKNIKKTYMLEDLDNSDSSDSDLENLENSSDSEIEEEIE